MGRKAETITARQVETITEPGRHKVVNSDVYLRVTDTGVKGWLFRYSFGGKQCELGFGAYSKTDNNLTDAKRKADVAKGHLAKGEDPKPFFQAERARLAGKPMPNDPTRKGRTFDETAAEFIANKGGGWSAKHRQQWESTLATYVAPHIGPKNVAAITTADVAALLKNESFWFEKTETAVRVLDRIGKVLDYATSPAANYRTGDNPARWRGALEFVLPAPGSIRKKGHYTAVDWRIVPKFYADLRAKGDVGALALRFSVLTAARRDEVRFMQWEQVMGNDWNVPAENMKKEIDHVVPLSESALEILSTMRVIFAALHGRKPEPNDYVFTANRGKPISTTTMIARVKRLGYDATQHGTARSSFRDWAGNNEYDRQAIEFCLAHKLKDQTERAYFRSNLLEPRRKIMADWAAYLEAAPVAATEEQNEQATA